MKHKSKIIKIVHCECCECYHRIDFNGDCREDSERFSDPEDVAERLGVSIYDIEEIDPESPEAILPLPPIGVGFRVGAGIPYRP